MLLQFLSFSLKCEKSCLMGWRTEVSSIPRRQRTVPWTRAQTTTKGEVSLACSEPLSGTWAVLGVLWVGWCLSWTGSLRPPLQVPGWGCARSRSVIQHTPAPARPYALYPKLKCAHAVASDTCVIRLIYDGRGGMTVYWLFTDGVKWCYLTASV